MWLVLYMWLVCGQHVVGIMWPVKVVSIQYLAWFSVTSFLELTNSRIDLID